MQNKKIILSILTLTLIIYMFHDFLPYHNHGANHYLKPGTSQNLTNTVENDNECDGHEMCVTCMLKVRNQFQHNHQEIDFHAAATKLMLTIKNVKLPKHLYAYSYQTGKIHILKSKYTKLPHSLRAPPIIV